VELEEVEGASLHMRQMLKCSCENSSSFVDEEVAVVSFDGVDD
jgi:hypothetical protein